VTHAVGARTHGGPVPLTAADCTDPETGEPGLRVRVLAPDGTELSSERRLSGRLLWLSDPVVSRAGGIEVTADLAVGVAGRWSVGLGGAGRLDLDVAGTALLTGEPAPEGDGGGLLVPAHRAVETELAVGTARITARVGVTPTDGPLHLASVWLAAAPPRPTAAEELAEAVRLAGEADAAVVVVGTTEDVESEGFDRTTIALPGAQDALVEAVAAANPRTVVVVNSGAPVALPWRERVPAVLLSWFPGQEFGAALADVLLGDREPGGRLPTTWAAREEDLPVRSTTPVDGVLDYAEGLDIGYRAWARHPVAPAYPFGHGLGYTTWELSTLDIAGATATVRLRNTGDRAGRQVVQAYLARPGSAVERPALWLAGFAAATVEPGAEADVVVPLERRAFEHWDDGAWRVEPGAFTVSVGFSAADRPLTATVTP
jgi:beta-glucosidase